MQEGPVDEGVQALGHLEQALSLLDQMHAPGEIGALVDHAIQRLRRALIARDNPVDSQSAE
jgi:hypothetical protein